jgi:hypothetical protein
VVTSVHRLSDFTGGWFVGDFAPSLLRNEHVEVCVKHFKEGDTELDHYQLTATEWTLIISGECIIGDKNLGPGDIIEIPPLEVAGFRALTDVSLVAVKSPSLPSDKVLA